MGSALADPIFMRDDKLLCAPEEKSNLEIANQATVIEYLADFARSGKTRITEGTLLEIHYLTIVGIYPCAGQYRDARFKIKITGTRHAPCHPSEIRYKVQELLDWLYSQKGSSSPTSTAAYALWKLNNIHPFAGGNGRVERSLAYLVMVTEVGPLFTGESLPAKLKKRKEEYLTGLQLADGGNHGPLKKLVLDLFLEQINELLNELKR